MIPLARLVFVALLALCASIPSRAQSVGVNTVVLAPTVLSAIGTVAVPVGTANAIGLTIQGNGSGMTAAVQGQTTPGGNWTTIPVVPFGGGSAVTSISGNGFWTVPTTVGLSAYVSVRLNVTALSSGSVTVVFGSATPMAVTVVNPDGTTVGGSTDPITLGPGSAIIGKVGIDQTTPGTTNGVQINAALPAGSNEIGFVGPSGSNGVDYSANAPSFSGLTLLATIPANTNRLGYFIQAQGTAALTVVMDDQAGSLTPTVMLLSGAGSNDSQGASLSMSGMPHTGRIRIYSTSSDVQMAARAW